MPRRPKHTAGKRIVSARVFTYEDTGQTRASVTWDDGSSTQGDPDNAHMIALLERARREGVEVDRAQPPRRPEQRIRREIAEILSMPSGRQRRR
jgi:hypothetical protein